MIDTIENYFLVSPFTFIEGHEGAPGEYIFPDPEVPGNMFHPWNEKRLGMLFPEANKFQKQLKEAGENIESADLNELKAALSEAAGTTAGELAFAVQRFGFMCGVLVGCKAMGATREQLIEKSRGFVVPTIGYAQYVAGGQQGESHG